MDAVELLITQHRTLEELLEQALAADGIEERKKVFERAGDHLTVHIASEEQVFYPAVKAARTEDKLLESLEEHLSLKRLLADLLELDPSDQTFEPKLKVLQEQTEHHHREEEEDLFPVVCKMIGEEQRETLGKEMMSLQNQMRKEGEPRDTVMDETDAAAPLK